MDEKDYSAFGIDHFEIPEEIERIITTPHEHEHPERRKPLWLIWKVHKSFDGMPEFPVLDSVCDSEKSARYHYRSAVSSSNQVFVERIPANHRFASSLGEIQFDVHKALWNYKNQKRTGD